MMSAWANQKGLSTNELNALLTRHSLACFEAARLTALRGPEVGAVAYQSLDRRIIRTRL